MNWYQCRTVEELKSVASFSVLKRKINDDLQGGILLKGRGWVELFQRVQILQNLFCFERSADIGFDGFSSEVEKYIFCLTEIDGANRLKHLGVSRLHYRNNDLAKKWRKKIIQKIHSDKCVHSRADEAVRVLNDMYAEMVK